MRRNENTVFEISEKHTRWVELWRCRKGEKEEERWEEKVGH